MSQWWTLTPTQCLHLEVWEASQTPNIHSWASVLPRTCSTHRLPASTNVSSGLPRLRSKSSKWPLTLLPSQFWSPIWSISKSCLFYLQNTSGIWPLPTPCIAATWSKPPILLIWVTEIASSLVFSSPLLPWTLQTMLHPDHRAVQEKHRWASVTPLFIAFQCCRSPSGWKFKFMKQKTHKTCSCLRTFALSVPSAQMALLIGIYKANALISFEFLQKYHLFIEVFLNLSILNCHFSPHPLPLLYFLLLFLIHIIYLFIWLTASLTRMSALQGQECLSFCLFYSLFHLSSVHMRGA